MLDLSVLTEPRKGQKAFRDFDLAKYSKSLFGMFAGEEVSVSLEARNDMAAITFLPRPVSAFQRC